MFADDIVIYSVNTQQVEKNPRRWRSVEELGMKLSGIKKMCELYCDIFHSQVIVLYGYLFVNFPAIVI